MVQFPGPPSVPVFPDPVKTQPLLWKKFPENPLKIWPGMRLLVIGKASRRWLQKTIQLMGSTGHMTLVTSQPALAAPQVETLDPGCLDPKALLLQEAAFERVFLSHWIHQTPHRQQLFHEIQRVLKPDGLLGVEQSLFDKVFLQRNEVIDWLKQAGFEPIASSGSFLHYLLLCRILTK